jgi:hypothetical protein
MIARHSLKISGRRANNNRNGQRKLSTHCRTGTSGKTWSIRSADVSTVRHAPAAWTKPRSLQENATRCSNRQPFTSPARPRAAASPRTLRRQICRRPPILSPRDPHFAAEAATRRHDINTARVGFPLVSVTVFRGKRCPLSLRTGPAVDQWAGRHRVRSALGAIYTSSDNNPRLLPGSDEGSAA